MALTPFFKEKSYPIVTGQKDSLVIP